MKHNTNNSSKVTKQSNDNEIFQKETRGYRPTGNRTSDDATPPSRGSSIQDKKD